MSEEKTSPSGFSESEIAFFDKVFKPLNDKIESGDSIIPTLLFEDRCNRFILSHYFNKPGGP